MCDVRFAASNTEACSDPITARDSERQTPVQIPAVWRPWATTCGRVSPIVGTGVSVVGVSALSLLGLLALGASEARVRALVPLLTSLAAGALVGAAVFDLIPEGFARHLGPRVMATGVGAGFAGFWLLERALHRVTRAGMTADGSAPGLPRFHPIVTLNFVGDVIHNAADGVMIAGAFIAAPRIGVITTLAIILHEIPRELGSFGVFLHGGLSVRRAVAYNGLTGVAALVGAAITLAVGMRVTGAVTLILPIAAGMFLFVAASIVQASVRAAPTAQARTQWLVVAGISLAVTAVASRVG